MATIKSYTDLEQSQKLAEILPLESADMCYPLPCEEGDKPLLEQGGFGSTPCWSLAALLHILPPSLFEYKRGIDLNVYPNLNGKGWHCSYMPNCIENMKIDKFKLITSGDSLINACYEMIIKLSELKMLLF